MSEYNSENAKERLLRRIRQDKRNSRKKFQYAAIGLIFFGLGYGYFQITMVENAVEPPINNRNEITLQLSDGRVKNISEENNTAIVDKNGYRVGVQNGNRLIYHRATTTKDLAYNTINVPYGKRLVLILADGTKAHLNSGTRLKYPVKFKNGRNREVFLQGEGYFDVAEDRAHPFIVNTEEVNIRVLGTQFNVSAYPNDINGSTVLVEGSVVVLEKDEPFDSIKNRQLKPGHIANWKKGIREMKIGKTDTNLYTGWMDGQLIFNHMPFRDVRKKLERNYDVTISNDIKELEKIQFTASFDTETIQQVLSAFSKNYPMRVSFEKNRIHIEKP
ncbi:FecR family protein [Pricia antarctica]|uniref:FecR family protein n=1 Tax=Pricia antarctica TaxID=641691 RepID=A0A1G7BIM3_9FLAO|nr:FecR domain-containing protein [Pricia antarctica]SDE26296.1 FecR family protein [Pricia antarctica]